MEDSNNNDENSYSKSDDRILSCIKKTELLKPSTCMFKCNLPKCIFTTYYRGKMESLVPCVRCLRCFHFTCQYDEDIQLFDHVINDNFNDGTKICHDCCLEYYNLRLQSKTDRSQRTSVFKQITQLQEEL